MSRLSDLYQDYLIKHSNVMIDCLQQAGPKNEGLYMSDSQETKEDRVRANFTADYDELIKAMDTKTAAIVAAIIAIARAVERH